MSPDIIVSSPPVYLFFPLLSIVLLAVAIIVGLDCVWRVEKRLDTFMKLLTAGVIFRIFQEITDLVAPDARAVLIVLNIFSSLLILMAMIEMYRIIRTWDNEDEGRIKNKE
jgi:hypothetical protein